MEHVSIAGQRLDSKAETPVNSHCPWSGNPVSDAATTSYRGQIVAFCNPGCRDKFEAATKHFDKAIEQAGEA